MQALNDVVITTEQLEQILIAISGVNDKLIQVIQWTSTMSTLLLMIFLWQIYLWLRRL